MKNKYFRLTLPLPESVNAYLHHKVAYKGKRPVVVAYKTKEAMEFEKKAEDIIKYQIQKQGWVKPNENVWIKVEACWFLNKNGCDGSNYFKQTLDILQRAGVYLNDSKVIENTINVFVDRNNPRVELNIYPLQKRGIFISDNQLEEFKNNNCCECSRPTTCRVLKNALDNKISEDINLADNMCFKKKTKK